MSDMFGYEKGTKRRKKDLDINFKCQRLFLNRQ